MNGRSFSQVAAEVAKNIRNIRMAVDGGVDDDWKRVNSYIADILKECSMLYAKLARLQTDFIGSELEELQRIAEGVLVLGDEMSNFSKSFYEGTYKMQPSEVMYGGYSGGGENSGGGGPPSPSGPPSPPSPPQPGLPPQPPSPPSNDEDYEVKLEVEDEDGGDGEDEKKGEEEESEGKEEQDNPDDDGLAL